MTQPSKRVEELVNKYIGPGNEYGDDRLSRTVLIQALTQLEAEKQQEVNLEQEYLSAYADFVDEMSVDTPFQVAFDTLNEKLSGIMDKNALTTEDNQKNI